MDISFSTIPSNFNKSIGYGYAGYGMVTSLQALGHRVPFSDPDAPVQIHFSQPTWYQFNGPEQYRIGYTPWESSELPEGWLEIFNDCDEIWTTSDICANWYEEAGVKPPIYVYEHGIDPVWKPKQRHIGDKIEFLHIGEPAVRKSGQETVNAFRKAFGDRDDVSLTIKAYPYNSVRALDRKGSILGPINEVFKNVRVISREFTEPEMVHLMRMHDVLIYPSYGEGFGLIPLQAMATGMPVICTEAWAPYRKFLLPEGRLSSTLATSKWPDVHPGNMFHPDFTELVDRIHHWGDRDNLAEAQRVAYLRSAKIHHDYDWLRLTENAFKHIVKKFS